MSTDTNPSVSEDSEPSMPDISPKLAHDLANVLAAAIASARLISRKVEDDEVKELADIVLRQLDKAANAIHDASE